MILTQTTSKGHYEYEEQGQQRSTCELERVRMIDVGMRGRVRLRIHLCFRRRWWGRRIMIECDWPNRLRASRWVDHRLYRTTRHTGDTPGNRGCGRRMVATWVSTGFRRQRWNRARRAAIRATPDIVQHSAVPTSTYVAEDARPAPIGGVPVGAVETQVASRRACLL